MTGLVSSLRLIPSGASPSGSARLGRPWAMAFRSAPAQKSPWSPNRTPTRAVSSRSNASKTAASASAVARSTALRTSGRLKRMVVTGPLFSTRTSMREASPQYRGRLFPSRPRTRKKTPAVECPTQPVFAICSPRGIGEPHDVAIRGSYHLSCVSIWARDGGPQGR